MEKEIEGCCSPSITTNQDINSNSYKDDQIYQSFKHMIIDSHCHIHEDTDEINSVVSSSTYPFKCSWLMGTTVQDWDRVDAYADLMGDRAIRCYGIHPWFAYQLHPPKELNIDIKDEQEEKEKEKEKKEEEEKKKEIIKYKIDDKWYIELVNRLEKYPNAMVGELGIDKVSKVRATGKCELEGQWAIFKRQIEIAAQYNRLISLHCVQLQGPLLQYFTDLPLSSTPKRIALHTFSGKPAMIQSLLKIKDKGSRFYFGISFINLSSSRVIKLIAAIPDNRLLLESDQNTPTCSESSVYDVLIAICKAKQWKMEQAILTTHNNAIQFQTTQI